MHYYIDYRSLSDTDAKAKAISDIKDWLGEERYLAITKGCREAIDENGQPEVLTFRQWRMAMFLSGIEGYPLKVWYNEIWPGQPTNDNSDLVTVVRETV